MPDLNLQAAVSIAKRFAALQSQIEQSRLRQLIAFAGGLFLGLYAHAAIVVAGRLLQ